MLKRGKNAGRSGRIIKHGHYVKCKRKSRSRKRKTRTRRRKIRTRRRKRKEPIAQAKTPADLADAVDLADAGKL